MINEKPLESLESMLFGLKDVMKDTDAVDVKKEIDRRLTQLSIPNNAVDIQEELGFVKETTATLSSSFQRRQQQMMTDAEIVRKIDLKIDAFRAEHKIKMDGLLFALMQDIDEAISNYADEIVKRLDPMVIKERFKKKEDFELWLNTINNNYKSNMEKTVDRKTQSTIRGYLVDVEDVYETASSYIANREALIVIEDSFYGSLATSKNMISRDIRNNIRELTVYNKSLYEASTELFNGIWEARKNFDVKRYKTTAVATVTGAGAVAAGSTIVTAAVIGSAAVTAATATAATAATAASASVGLGTLVSVGLGASYLPIIAGVAALAISGIVIAKTAHKLSTAIYSGKMEADVQSCINEFMSEIDKSKLSMQAHITDSVQIIFENELKSLDRTFLEFRKATYIDENKIPKLAERLHEIEGEVMAV